LGNALVMILAVAVTSGHSIARQNKPGMFTVIGPPLSLYFSASNTSRRRISPAACQSQEKSAHAAVSS
jgi:hypothetical protein